jgi:type II secretory ATPase GspE/PulE/Tfp pilus assembly ATPase PilB-like protein
MVNQMKVDVVLELMDGRSLEAVLARPFIPEENEIRIMLAKGGTVHTYLLSKVCCVLMVPNAQQMMFYGKEHYSEEVITTTDKHFHVAILKDLKARNGFYGLYKDIRSPFKLIFFTNNGIKLRKQGSLVGEILQDKGLVTHHSINEALEEQRKLRERRLGDIISEEHDLHPKIIENVIETAYKEGKVTPRMKIGDILINAGLVTGEQVADALASQDIGKRKKIGTLLIDKGLITEEQLLMVLALKFRLRFVDIEKEVPKKEALDAIPAYVVYGLRVLPLDDDGKHLIVATSEPTDHTLPESLRFYTKRWIEMVVSSPRQISRAILKYYPQKEYRVDDILYGMSVDELVVEPDAEISDIDTSVSESDSNIVMLVNKILLDGYSQGASDIHFEPALRDQPFQVRYRIDGTCRLAHQIPAGYKRAIISRLKIMSNLDISEHGRPQSGKILIWQQNKQIEYRVEVSPTVGGNEDAVLRILTSAEPLPLEDMGFSANNMAAFRRFLTQAYGIILCVGPTGSGKTTTLHAALKFLNTPEVKIWTVEDPVEITQWGLRQVQVHSKIGLTFQEALISCLRSDPDVIMVGEMRDTETAKIAIEASLTGHLVLSTFHTNSAPETVVRLIAMGMDPFNFADSLLGVLAQRLARRLCEKCKEPYHPDKEEYDELATIYDQKWFLEHNVNFYSDDLTLMKKVGCHACNNSGYKGRAAIHELLVNTESIKQLIRHRAALDEIRTMAMKEGMRTLLMDGIQKVFQGITDREELLRVCRYEKRILGSGL